MSILASPRRSSPEPLPSLPPSPLEEDLGWRAPWSHSDDDDDDSRLDATTSSPQGFQQSKGKERATKLLPTSYANGGRGEVSQRRRTEEYPPTTDEATETRRVQENLMLWEVAERQRRKSARETAASTSSIVVDVARRASALWTRRSSHHSVDGGGKHRVLQTSEDHVRLDDIVASPLHSAPPSPSPSPSPGLSPNHNPVTGPGPYPRDPFTDPLPGGSASSLFVNALPTAEIDPASTAVELQTPTSAEAPLFTSPPAVPHSGKRFSAKVVSAPAPLDLPRPRSPPPRTATPHAKRPPEPFPRPDSRMSRTAEEEEEEEDATPVRWWTEWLCGCSEGPDRGGEVQAGRTNPME